MKHSHDRLLNTVRGVIMRNALLEPKQRVIAAVSGGADSSALLALAVRAGRPVHAVHVDHGLRPDSATDAARATSAAMMLGATSARSMRVSISARSR